MRSRSVNASCVALVLVSCGNDTSSVESGGTNAPGTTDVEVTGTSEMNVDDTPGGGVVESPQGSVAMPSVNVPPMPTTVNSTEPSGQVPTPAAPGEELGATDVLETEPVAETDNSTEPAESGEEPDGGVVMEPGSDPGEPEPQATECDASQAPAVGGLGLELILSSSELNGVSYARQPPNSDDWYLVEQRGRILVYADGQLRTTPFLDLSAEVSVDPTYDERGLHAIEFAPDYETSGLFYIVMTASAGERANRDMVLEYRRSGTDPYVAETTATKALVDLEGLTSNTLFANIHNAYLAKFGPDGMLYVGMGDGGGQCNDNTGFVNLPQDITSPVGKILRLDPSAEAPYGAADNPFVDSGDPRVYHLGVRNPFRFSWDAVTGELYVGDVGQDTHEEISVVARDAAGLNFGWATWEGDEMVCSNRPLGTPGDLVEPIFVTDHGQGNNQFGAGCSASAFCDYGAIVGGAVYRGGAIPKLQGAYVFGDWVGDNMAALYHCDGAVSEVTSIDYVPDPNLPGNGYLLKADDGVPDLAYITAIVEDHDYELVLVANGDTLLRIVDEP